MESNAKPIILSKLANRAQSEIEAQEEWDNALKPATIDSQGNVKELGDRPVKANQILPNTSRGNAPITTVNVPGGIVADWIVADWVTRLTEEEEEEIRQRKKENLFASMSLLVSVERDEEYELWLMTENLTQLKAGRRSWDISYVESLPKYFDGAAWNAWGYFGFTSKGIFSGAEYGFIDTIPTEKEIGIPSLLWTKVGANAATVNDQLGVSSPLFWDEGNPAPVTKVKASFTLTDLWFSGFFQDNYLEITHLYKDRYGALSFATGREITRLEDWWIYPYFNKDVNIEHSTYDMDVDIYRYKYSEDGAAIDFDSLDPAEYTTVIIPLYKIDPETDLPILDEVGDPILATSSATATSETIQEEEWQRTDPETCEEITGECVYDNRTVQSDLTDFGTATSWDIECFNPGNVIVYDGETDIETIAVSAMPVTLQWEEVPNGLVYKYEGIDEVLVEDVVSFLVTNLGDGDPDQARVTIVGSVDTFKSSPSAVENNPVTSTEILVTPPVTIVTESVNEFRWKWSSQSTYKEINANSYVTGSEIADGRDAGITITPVLRKRGDGRYDAFNIYNADPNDWIFSDSLFRYAYTISASFGAEFRAYWESIVATPSLPCNFNTYTIAAPTSAEGYFALYFTETPIRVMNPYVCATGGYSPGLNSGLNNGKHRIGRGLYGTDDDSDYLTPAGHIRSRTARPYVLFNTGVKDYAPTGTDTLEIIASTDTRVTVNGTEYFYADTPTITTDYQTRIDWELNGGGTGSYTDFDFEYATLQEEFRLKVFEDGIEIFESFYNTEFPARLEGTKNITEYKRFIHNASIQFSRQFPGNPVGEWVWFKSGQGQITIDTIEGDCKQEGEFVYDVTTKSGKLGKTTITEQDSDREPGILWKFIEYRPVDDVLDEEVEPELSLTYVHAGGKVYSGIHSKNALVEQTKRVANPSTSHQFSEIGGTPKVSIEDSLSSFTVAAPKEDGANAKWSLDSMPPTIEQQSRDANYAPDGISIGETLDFIGTFDSDPPNVGGSVWQTDWVGLPLDYEGEIDEGLGIQLSNHHEYYVPRKREYRQRNISGWSDAGEWLNGWEPINTVGLSGFLPSGEFRSLSLYHETTRARLQYGIKGCLDTVQGVNGEPLHFAFAYGGIYAAFGKVNDGLDDDNFAMLRTQASTNTTQIFINKNEQTSSNPPVPPSWDTEALMEGYGYSWGGFRRYICPYTPGLAVEVNGLSKQLPGIIFKYPTILSTEGIESLYQIGFRYVDPTEDYRIFINGTEVLKTGTTRAGLIANFVSDITPLLPTGATITSDNESITITGVVEVTATPTRGLTGFEVETTTNDEIEPGATESATTYTIYFPGINAPYSLDIDGTEVNLTVANIQGKTSALSTLLANLSAYEAEIVGNYVEVQNVYVVEKISVRDYNDIVINPAVQATSSTDKPWRGDEIRWDSTPTVGLNSVSPLETSSTANVSSNLKYDRFNYSKQPYARLDPAKNPGLFITHDSDLLNLPQPGGLLDQDFTETPLIVEYGKADGSWNEIELQCNQVKPEWFAADREKINIIAIAPVVIDYLQASEVKDLAMGEANDEVE